MPLQKENISFILIEPGEAGNIGASARAIKNMGFRCLELVRPKNFPSDEALRFAANAGDVLKNAVIHKTFNEAIRKKSLIVGTSRRVGRRRGPILPLKEGIKRIIGAAKKNKVAILFGREDRGLINEEVGECGFLMTIPTAGLDPSLNLAQAVLLVAYELHIKEYKTVSPELVTHEEIENLLDRIRSMLKLLGYIPGGDRNLEAKITRNLKHLIGRAGLTDWEVGMLHGIISQMEKAIKKKR